MFIPVFIGCIYNTTLHLLQLEANCICYLALDPTYASRLLRESDAHWAVEYELWSGDVEELRGMWITFPSYP